MARSPIRQRDIENPERILQKLLNDYIEGRLDSNNVLYRAVVLEVDTVGAKLAGPGTKRPDEPPNPRGSIKARIITDSLNKFTEDDDLPILWPLFPFDLLPIKESEHVYVVFEDSEQLEHGLWITRIPEPLNTHNANLTPGSKKYLDDSENELSPGGAGEKAVQDTEVDPGTVTPSSEFTIESVPSFRARIGDRVIEGSNNTIIILGRDRPSDVASGQQQGAGTIDLVAGRSTEDLDFADDKSRIYISSKTDIDKNLATKNDPGSPVDGKAAIIVKSDEIRIIAREGMKLVVEGGDLHLEGKNIFLGKDATQSLMQGEFFATLWKAVLTLIANHNHPSAVPNAPSPALAALLTAVKNDLANAATGPVLSKTVKTKG